MAVVAVVVIVVEGGKISRPPWIKTKQEKESSKQASSFFCHQTQHLRLLYL